MSTASISGARLDGGGGAEVRLTPNWSAKLEYSLWILPRRHLFSDRR